MSYYDHLVIFLLHCQCPSDDLPTVKGWMTESICTSLCFYSQSSAGRPVVTVICDKCMGSLIRSFPCRVLKWAAHSSLTTVYLGRFSHHRQRSSREIWVPHCDIKHRVFVSKNIPGQIWIDSVSSAAKHLWKKKKKKGTVEVIKIDRSVPCNQILEV